MWEHSQCLGRKPEAGVPGDPLTGLGAWSSAPARQGGSASYAEASGVLCCAGECVSFDLTSVASIIPLENMDYFFFSGF